MSVNYSLDLDMLSANRDAVSRTYWKGRLAGFEGNACFEDQSAVAGNNGSEHIVYRLKASEETDQQLRSIAGSDKAIHIVLLCAVAVLAHKLSAATDMLIFTPLYPPATGEQPIPVRIRLLPGENFQQLIMRVKEQLLDDMGHGVYPVRKILDAAEAPLPLAGMQLEEFQQVITRKSDILFSFNRQNGLSLRLEYNPDKFSASYISSIAGNCLYLLQQLIIHREKPVGELDMITPEDEALINIFNDTEIPYPHTATIISLFEDQVCKTPGNIAVCGFGGEYTYQALNELSGKVADYLRDQAGVKPGDLVGLMLEREGSLMPAVFGILKAGGVYVPIDPHFPPARVQAITDDSGLKVVITRGKFIPQLQGASLQIIDLDNLTEIISNLPVTTQRADVLSGQLAYVIYTSGSTGKPKGVMITHTALVNRLLWMQKQFPIGEQDVLLQKTPLVFDVSVWELFWWSFTGASLCMLKPGGEKDPAELMTAIQQYHVSTIHFVPSMLKAFLTWFEKYLHRNPQSSLRQVFASGEALKADYVQLFKNTMHASWRTKLINLYGPTEATVDVSCYECDFTQDIHTVPIGRPIDNIRLYIMNPALRLLPVGVPGDLYIAGVGLAAGYLNNETLTAKKFIEHPYRKDERMYKTGDRAKLQEDGNIIFLGREDEQLKIRGYRIEPGEIESRLCEHNAIQDAVVIAKEWKEEMQLIAYYVAENVQDTAILRSFLQHRLPDYMLPSWFVQLDNIPLTSNGKLNRKALPDPQIKTVADHKAPSGETETQLLEIWATVLGIDKTKISATANFFELGGNSLKLMHLNLIVNESLSTAISIPEMFSYPTIRTLAKFISSATTGWEGYKEEARSEVGSMHNLIDILNNI